jgi:lauroyl/myristoyl acyltransferase
MDRRPGGGDDAVRRVFFAVLAWLGAHVGVWVVAAFAWVISTGYFLLLPRRLATSLRFYRAAFPEGSAWGRLRLAWGQYHGFAALIAERLRLAHTPEQLRYTMDGLEHIEAAAAAGHGAILLMSHLGNWELGARLLGQRQLRLLLFMGEKQREQIERQQKEDLRLEGVRVVALAAGAEATTEGLEGLRFLRDGGLVSLAGDRVWSPGQSVIHAQMLGRRVALPKAPHALALVSGAPIITFFVVRTGRCTYHFRAFPPTRVAAASRRERDDALAASAQRYVAQLEEVVRRHPTQWYHFEPFLDRGNP